MYLEDYNIALMGRKGSGKSTIAKYFIQEDESFKRVSFAKPLKDMIRTFLKAYGLNDETVEHMVDGHLKEQPITGLDVTPRHLMQTIGTEWGRECVGEDVWGDLMRGSIQTIHTEGNKFICDDARFNNEVDNLMEYDTLLIRVMSDKEEAGDGHASEVLPTAQPDIIFLNEFNKDIFFSKRELKDALKDLSIYDLVVIHHGEVHVVDYRELNYNSETTTFKQVKDLL